LAILKSSMPSTTKDCNLFETSDCLLETEWPAQKTDDDQDAVVAYLTTLRSHYPQLFLHVLRILTVSEKAAADDNQPFSQAPPGALTSQCVKEDPGTDTETRNANTTTSAPPFPSTLNLEDQIPEQNREISDISKA